MKGTENNGERHRMLRAHRHFKGDLVIFSHRRNKKKKKQRTKQHVQGHVITRF